MNGNLWEHNQEHLRKVYPQLIVHPLAEHNHLVAIEDRETSAADRSLYSDSDAKLAAIKGELGLGHNDVVEKLSQEAIRDGILQKRAIAYAAQLYFALGLSYSRSGQYGKAREYLEKALEARGKSSNLKDLESLLYFDALGDVFMSTDDAKSAEKIYRQELQIASEIASGDLANPPPPQLAVVYKKVIDSLKKQGKSGEAEAMEKRPSGLQQVDDIGKANSK
jgi:uncharacterized protein HemY